MAWAAAVDDRLKDYCVAHYLRGGEGGAMVVGNFVLLVTKTAKDVCFATYGTCTMY